MQKNIIIGIIILAVIVVGIIAYKRKTTQNASQNMNGMDMSMPGMDHSNMQMSQ